jgi:hypothetical protein
MLKPSDYTRELKVQAKEACEYANECLVRARELTSDSCKDVTSMRRTKPYEDSTRAWVNYYKANQHAIYARNAYEKRLLEEEG